MYTYVYVPDLYAAARRVPMGISMGPRGVGCRNGVVCTRVPVHTLVRTYLKWLVHGRSYVCALMRMHFKWRT